MAVYTQVAFEELGPLLACYDIGEPVSFKGIAEGVENSNFQLRTDRGAFILTLFEKRVREPDLPFFLGLMRHFSKRGIPCPVPVACSDGSDWTHISGHPAALLSWLDGLSLRRPQVPHCAEAGRACARLHLAAEGFALHRPNALSGTRLGELAASTVDKADGVQPGLGELISQTLVSIGRDWPDALPSGVIHADLFPDNVLFLNDRISGLIDFYFACNDFFAFDVAVMLNAWCFEPDGTYNLTKGTALLSGYTNERILARAELDALPVLARGAALRFLLTRLYDWLNPRPQSMVFQKDPKEFAKRLRFHLGATNAAAYGLNS